MSNKGRGKELKVDVADNYNTLIGTVDNKDPKAVYFRISAWGAPTDEQEDEYDKIIRSLDKKIRTTVYETLADDLFERGRTIVDLDMRESGVSYNKRSFMSCEVTLFQSSNHQINSDIMKTRLTELMQNVVNGVFENTEYFEFYKTKK